MDRIKTFDEFYRTRIEPQLDDLNKQDRQANYWGTVMFLALLATVGSLILAITSTTSWGGGFVTAILAAFAFYSVYKYTKQDDDYTDNFKDNVIAAIIRFIDPGFIYKPGSMVPSREYISSGLFRHRYDYIDGDDYIGGTYKDVHFHCSELHTYYHTVGSRYSGGKVVTIFKGLFFAGAVNKSFTGGTYIWLKNDEQLSATIADEHFRMLPLPPVNEVQTGNALFDQYYSMCTTMPSDAKKIIDSGLLDNLLQFRRQLKRKVLFSVVAGQCYVAIPISEDLLEPTTPVGDRDEVKKYFYTILLVLSIINQLHLNELV